MALAQASILSPLQAFLEELAQFQDRLDTHRGPVSCALVALMAHGGPQGQLLAVDGQAVWPEALVQELSGCRALRGCPKIFLLQACRGGEQSSGPPGGPVRFWPLAHLPLPLLSLPSPQPPGTSCPPPSGSLSTGPFLTPSPSLS